MTTEGILLLIAVLACPAIMYWMMRGHRSSAADGDDPTPRSPRARGEREDRHS